MDHHSWGVGVFCFLFKTCGKDIIKALFPHVYILVTCLRKLVSLMLNCFICSLKLDLDCH